MTFSHNGDTNNTRPTIGVLTNTIYGSLPEMEWRGFADAAVTYDVNLICFLGMELHAPVGFRSQANVMFDLATPQRLDGVIIQVGAIGAYASWTELLQFCRRYEPLPVVTIEETFKGIPGVIMGDYDGIRQIMEHLITHHSYRRIAFIRGPETHAGAEERYRAYCDTMTRYGLPLDPDLISPPAQVWWPPPADLFDRFLDRNVRMEAIVAASDGLALWMLKALQKRGIRVPADVAVCGFDDAIESRAVAPPITTVRPSHYEKGWKAVELLIESIRGREIPEHTPVYPGIVIRRSCGCLSSLLEQVNGASNLDASPQMLLPQSPENVRAQLQATVEQTLSESLPSLGSEQVTAFWHGLDSELQGESAEELLRLLDELLRQSALQGGDVAMWQTVFSLLCHRLKPLLTDANAALRLENLCRKAHILIGDVMEWAVEYQQYQKELQSRVLREIGESLISHFDVAAILDILAQELPRLNIRSCYLSLYDNPKQPIEQARLILAYTEHGRADLSTERPVFPAHHLLPDEMILPERRATWVVVPLFFQEEQLGFAVIEMGAHDANAFEALRIQISSALQGALLVQRVRKRTAQLIREKYITDTFMANVPDAIYFKDRESRITRSNRAYRLRVGLQTPDEMIGKTDFDFFSQTEAQVKFEQEQEIMRTGQPVLSVEEPDGEGNWSLTTKMPLRDEHEQIIGTFGISRDITPLKQAEAKIRALNEQLKDENIRMNAEMDLARRIQTSLLPQVVKDIHPDFDIAALMLPAEEVGGDYYDITLDRDGHLWFGIGDVSGHGVTPGLIMMMAQTVHTTITANYHASPKDVVVMVNNVLYKNVHDRLGADHFMTFTALKYLEHGRFQHAGAHVDLIVYRKQTGTCERIDTTGTWLNFVPDISHATRNSEFSLDVGDLLILYTDGLTEAWNSQKELLDIQRFMEIIATHADQTDVLRDAILNDVLEWCQNIRDDDMSLVVARRIR